MQLKVLCWSVIFFRLLQTTLDNWAFTFYFPFIIANIYVVIRGFL